MTERKDKENKLIALMSTGGVQLVLLFLAFFFISWQEPDPPLSSLSGANGIELNFGMDTEGSGDIQPTEPVGTDKPKEEKAEENKEEQQAKPQEEVEAVEPVKESKVKDAPVEKVVTGTDDESPVSVKEKKEAVKPVEKPKEKVEVKPKEEVRKEDSKAVYKPNTSKTDTEKTTGDGKEGKPGNQGDDKNKTGDKGDPRGTPDAKAMYGNPGSGGDGPGGNGGTGLDLYGWDWDYIPKPNIPDNETGRIVFLVEVDEDGTLQRYQKESSTVSIATERACIASIERLTFSKKSGAKVPPISKGRITFVIRQK